MVADKSVEEIELILKQFVDEARIRKAEDQKDFRTYPMYIHRFNYLKSDYSGSYFEYAEYQRDPELQELHARQHQELLNALPPMKEWEDQCWSFLPLKRTEGINTTRAMFTGQVKQWDCFAPFCKKNRIQYGCASVNARIEWRTVGGTGWSGYYWRANHRVRSLFYAECSTSKWRKLLEPRISKCKCNTDCLLPPAKLPSLYLNNSNSVYSNKET